RSAVLYWSRFTVESADPDPNGGCSATGEVTKEQSYYPERVKRAAHMLFFKRGRVPGARSWELKTGLGKEYLKALAQLDEALKDLDLEVKKVESQTLSDYRTRAELDLESLMMLIAESKPKGAIVEEEPGEASESAETVDVEGPAETVEAELEDQASTEG